MDGDIVELKIGQERLAGEIRASREVQASNHKQNRGDIHALRDTMQTVVGEVGEIKIKFARLGGYAAGAGTMVALIAHFIDKLWK